MACELAFPLEEQLSVELFEWRRAEDLYSPKWRWSPTAIK